jgi:hypothetical protein
MYISIENYKYDEALGATVYILQVGILQGQEVTVHSIVTRFSDMSKFNDVLRPVIEKCDFVKPFPKKKWFGNTDPAFIKTRCEDLEKYFASLTAVPGILHNEYFQNFFGIKCLKKVGKRASCPF